LIALYIVLGIILLLFILLILPITVYFYADGNVKCKIYFSGIKLFDTEKVRKIKPENEVKKEKSEKKPESKKEKDSFVKKLFDEQKEKNGTAGAIKFFAKTIGAFLNKIIWIIRKLKFSKIKILLNIGSENAAKTAVEYGAVCTAVYPILSLVTANADVKYKAVDINADFNSTCITGNIEFRLTARLIYLVIGLVLGYSEYKKIKKGKC